jgi:hypothetical protein
MRKGSDTEKKEQIATVAEPMVSVQVAKALVDRRRERRFPLGKLLAAVEIEPPLGRC